ncbi:MAG: COQ9 family protein [Paracoccus sp. (in: a-proteobacteria)]|uniref:COQ9 family protein n=1 Tax=Paracoccus sp. TaxID=267 RepID=UPI0026E00DFE|nr:COQ9 family protein [Paracoccus sp. (in: a-proteobacteria)]MDO5611833.1 COQ9 family protein [Paracoccus sp. (in: a-proteobacteria)]
MTQTDALIDAALIHVPFEGMNDRALTAGARDLGIAPELARVLVPMGGAGLAASLHRRGDAALARWLADTPPQGRFRDKVAAAVWHRLELSDRELVRAASATLALPQNAALAARLMWETADTIWTGLGDSSDDVNWYSKRAILAGVHSAAALYWLGDDSEGGHDTRAFIDRRIDGVMRFEKIKAAARKVPGVAMLADLATGWVRAPQGPADLPGRAQGGKA